MRRQEVIQSKARNEVDAGRDEEGKRDERGRFVKAGAVNEERAGSTHACVRARGRERLYGRGNKLIAGVQGVASPGV